MPLSLAEVPERGPNQDDRVAPALAEAGKNPFAWDLAPHKHVFA